MISFVIVSSEAYDSSSTSTSEKHDDSEEESLDHREVVATIRQLKNDEGGARGKVEISLNHGSSWEATPLINGGYEFVAKESSQTVARWVPRRPSKRRRSNTMQSATTIRSGEEGKKFNFSVINPNTRRHPIIASVSRTTIDILDRYASPSSALASPPQSSSSTRSSQSDYFEDAQEQPSPMMETDEQLRTLIVVTGIWVAFRENWSPNFHYNDAMSMPSLSSIANTHPSHRTRSLNSGDGAKNHSHNRDGHSSRHNTLHHLGGMVRQTGTQLLHRSHVSATNAGHVAALNLQPQRAHSTGTSFITSVHSVHDRGPSATSRGGQGTAQSTMTLPYGQGRGAIERRAHTTIANGPVVQNPSSSGSDSFVSSERYWKAEGRGRLTGESSRSSNHGRRLDTKTHPTQGNDDLLGRRRKGIGKLNRLFNIVRRTSSTHQH